ncbi:MAG: HAMP domain-containing histidine kinase [Deltaproteobacteria bacterium]|nr:HAMP domain-containing histidine kinase [Deltaproteobacteria bacterium]
MSSLFSEQSVVVADTDAESLEVVCRALGGQGFFVLRASSVDEATRAIKGKGASLLLWDSILDFPTGLPIDLRVLWMIPEHDRAAKKRAIFCGARDVVEKPIDDRDLILRVRNQLSQLNVERMVEMQKSVLQEELHKATGHLVESERLSFLGTLSGGVGHELNNLAQVMRGILDRLNEDLHVPADVRKDLDYTYEHLHMHAHHLQNMGRPDEDEQRDFYLGDVLDRVLKNARLSGRLKQVKVNVFGLCDEMWVEGSPQRVGQVLNNLLQNAADAALSVDRAIGEKSWVEITLALLDDDDVLVEVQDNGPGIKAEDLERVFRPYFTTKPKGEGTGLGLSVVQRILKAHHTSLSTENREAGACFSFRLLRGERP